VPRLLIPRPWIKVDIKRERETERIKKRKLCCSFAGKKILKIANNSGRGWGDNLDGDSPLSAHSLKKLYYK
jgi:hypothetical protein